MQSKAELYRDIAVLLDHKERLEKEREEVKVMRNEYVYVNIGRDLFNESLRIDRELYLMILNARISDIDKAINIIKDKINN